MNFTREPIIETIITPKDGFRLIVRSSKGTTQEEYSVEALEVVSFGNTQFFRSLEKPKCFLLPISDYEVVETREAKIVIKNPAIDKTIKIAGGKEHHPKQQLKEANHSESVEPQVDSGDEEKEAHFEKRKDKKKNRRKKALELRQQEKSEGENKPHEEKIPIETSSAKKMDNGDEQSIVPPVFSTLLPPPTTLISETLGRYKAMESSENFMMPKAAPKESESDVQAQVEAYVQGDNEELDQIWSHTQSEETFIGSESFSKDEEPSQETVVLETAQSEEEKNSELDIDKFIE